jgi:hypothetical protein
MEPSYENMKKLMEYIHKDFEILAGNEVGPSHSSWQDVAGTAACSLKNLAALVEASRVRGSFVTFPCFSEIPHEPSEAG